MSWTTLNRAHADAANRSMDAALTRLRSPFRSPFDAPYHQDELWRIRAAADAERDAFRRESRANVRFCPCGPELKHRFQVRAGWLHCVHCHGELASGIGS